MIGKGSNPSTWGHYETAKNIWWNEWNRHRNKKVWRGIYFAFQEPRGIYKWRDWTPAGATTIGRYQVFKRCHHFPESELYFFSAGTYQYLQTFVRRVSANRKSHQRCPNWRKSWLQEPWRNIARFTVLWQPFFLIILRTTSIFFYTEIVVDKILRRCVNMTDIFRIRLHSHS